MSTRKLTTLTAAIALLISGTATANRAQISGGLTVLSTYDNGGFDEGAAEIAAYDPISQQVFVTNAESNTIDWLYIGNPAAPELKGSIDLSPYGGGVNSVAVNGAGLVAAAVEADDTQAPGSVVFFAANGRFLAQVPVGPLPDMVTFTPDGLRVIVANEGEPNDDYSIDPAGSISIITLAGSVTALDLGDVQTLSFDGFSADDLVQNGVRIFGPGASAAEDLEPEYIAVTDDGQTAYVTLQENNAVAVVDIPGGEIEGIITLGTKDHSRPENAMDASDEDGAINITPRPTLGLYLPDAIAAVNVNGIDYFLTANEGDAREYEGFIEEARVADVTLDPTAFPNAAELQAESNLGRLKITTTLGDTDGDGDFDELYSFGARSFSVWSETGTLVWDSGSELERITAERLPDNFNSTNDENNSFDDRSDDKGPEPEGITTGQIGDTLYAFVGLERVGGIMVYDITDPTAPEFVTYTNNRNFSGDAAAGTAGDLAPEGLLFISAAESPTGEPLLVVTNEVSGTTTIYSLAGL